MVKLPVWRTSQLAALDKSSAQIPVVHATTGDLESLKGDLQMITDVIYEDINELSTLLSMGLATTIEEFGKEVGRINTEMGDIEIRLKQELGGSISQTEGRLNEYIGATNTRLTVIEASVDSVKSQIALLTRESNEVFKAFFSSVGEVAFQAGGFSMFDRVLKNLDNAISGFQVRTLPI